MGDGLEGRNQRQFRGWIERSVSNYPRLGGPPQHTLHCDPRVNLMLLPSNSPASPGIWSWGPMENGEMTSLITKISGESCIKSFLKYSLSSHQVPGPVLNTGDLEIIKILSLSSRNSGCSRTDFFTHSRNIYWAPINSRMDRWVLAYSQTLIVYIHHVRMNNLQLYTKILNIDEWNLWWVKKAR